MAVVVDFQLARARALYLRASAVLAASAHLLALAESLRGGR
jgi:hypothetical protein